MHTPTKLISTLIFALAAVGSSFAQGKEEDHKAHHPQAAASMASKPAGMGSMHDMHEKHQKEMTKIHGTKNAAKRQKLMDKHMKEMHEHMDQNGGMDKDGNMGMMGKDAPMGAKPMQGAASK
ncbi:hypothetical protein [Aquabacterium sp.]|uniref:hypothetical protein n=1 Tax=Aquabacterium sp. TaxID=1872578 RepID=UPI002488B22B|nr:hypothetical protein [Aquabacterium sp.]MDI1260822.1 hypothetical protein [Aquabacterium sp.]